MINNYPYYKLILSIIFRSTDRDTLPSGFSFVREVVLSYSRVTILYSQEYIVLIVLISSRRIIQYTGSLLYRLYSDPLSKLERFRI